MAGLANDDESGGASGAHFNPLSAPHGCYPDTDIEAGDLIADLADFSSTTDSGATRYFGSVLRSSFDLTGENSVLGRAIVVHQALDDCTGGHGGTGNAGPRIAQGVIGTGSFEGCDNCGSETELSDCQSLVARIAATATVENPLFADVTNHGTVSFISAACDEGEGATGINMRVCLSGLDTHAKHGLHIHQYGDWSTADALSTGGHWNLDSEQPHGLPSSDQHHSGDLGNVEATSAGSVSFFLNLPLSPTSFTMNDLIGLAVVLHTGSDDGVTQPTGDAGSRMAMGVIGVGNTASTIDDYNWCTASTANNPTSASTNTAELPHDGRSAWLWVFFGLIGFTVLLFVCGDKLRQWRKLNSMEMALAAVSVEDVGYGYSNLSNDL